MKTLSHICFSIFYNSTVQGNRWIVVHASTYHLKEGRLTGSVVTDDRYVLAFFDLEVNTGKELLTSERFRKVHSFKYVFSALAGGF